MANLKFSVYTSFDKLLLNLLISNRVRLSYGTQIHCAGECKAVGRFMQVAQCTKHCALKNWCKWSKEL